MKTSAEGHAALANLYCMDDFNPPASEKEFQRAIALDPNYATAHHWFSNSLLVTVGRLMKRSKKVNAPSSWIHFLSLSTRDLGKHVDAESSL